MSENKEISLENVRRSLGSGYYSKELLTILDAEARCCDDPESDEDLRLSDEASYDYSPDKLKYIILHILEEVGLIKKVIKDCNGYKEHFNDIDKELLNLLKETGERRRRI